MTAEKVEVERHRSRKAGNAKKRREAEKQDSKNKLYLKLIKKRHPKINSPPFRAVVGLIGYNLCPGAHGHWVPMKFDGEIRTPSSHGKPMENHLYQLSHGAY